MEGTLANRPTQGRILLLVADDGNLVHDPAVRRIAREFARAGLAVDLFTPPRVLSSRHQIGIAACRDLGVDHILDLGFIPQDDEIAAAGLADVSYHFVFDGLTHEEAADVTPFDDLNQRFIPWTIADRQTPERVALTSRLVNQVSPHGFVYLPEAHPHEKEGPRPLDPGQMDRILEKTQFHVWRGEDDRLYLESSRFRACLQAGCLPLIVVGDESVLPADLPFRDFVVRERDVVDRLRGSDFETERRSFQAEFLRLPRLGEGLDELIGDFGGTRPVGRALHARPQARACTARPTTDRGRTRRSRTRVGDVSPAPNSEH